MSSRYEFKIVVLGAMCYEIDWDVSLAIDFVNKWKRFYLKILKQILFV